MSERALAYFSGLKDEAGTFRQSDQGDIRSRVIERFRERYGVTDAKKYYSKFDVAVEAK